MSKIVWLHISAEEISAAEAELVQKRERKPAFQCFGCGRFAKLIRGYQQYNGTWNIHYADVSCSRCGDYTEALT